MSMNKKNTLIEKKISAMDFDGLRDYLKIQIDMLGSANNDSTLSKDELLELFGILKSKVTNDYKKALDAITTPQFSSFIASDRLRILEERRGALKKQLPDRHVKRNNTVSKQVQTIYKEMSSLFKEIESLKIQEMEEQRKGRVRKHELAIKEYFKKRGKVKLVEEQKKQARIIEVKNIREMILNYFNSRRPEDIRRISWQILPPGKWSIDQITKHYRALESNNSKGKYELNRLESLKTLNPTTCYIGLEEFEGYVVFCFDYTEKAILENPVRGNAIYVIYNNWPEMSKMTKRELLTNQDDNVKRIIHRGDWFQRLKSNIINS